MSSCRCGDDALVRGDGRRPRRRQGDRGAARRGRRGRRRGQRRSRRARHPGSVRSPATRATMPCSAGRCRSLRRAARSPAGSTTPPSSATPRCTPRGRASSGADRAEPAPAVAGAAVEVRRFLAGGAGGAIVNVSSHQARRAVYGALPYATAKAAVEGLTRALAVDYGRRGIRANAVALGSINTERYDQTSTPSWRGCTRWAAGGRARGGRGGRPPAVALRRASSTAR